MFDVIQNPYDGRFIVKKTEDLTKIGQYTFDVNIWLIEYDNLKITGKHFVVNIRSPCTPEYLEIVYKWPLLCPKPKPAEI
jgi:hypothetical protein